MVQVEPLSEIEKYALSRRRWPIMIVFMVYGMTSVFQTIQFTVVSDIFVTYYGVSMNAISWTSIIHMAVFIPLLAPAMWLVDNIGLRKVLLIGAGLNAAGTIIKCFAAQPHLFGLGLVFDN